MNGVPTAFIPMCPHRPMNLGHVGWGYEYPDGSFCIGAVEGPGWRQGNKNGFWCQRVPNLDAALQCFASMKSAGAEYDFYKILRVTPNVTPNPAYADQIVNWVAQQDYDVAGRNCMNSAYDILLAFAPGYTVGMLPKPEHHWIPNDWLNNIVTQEYYTLPAVREHIAMDHLEHVAHAPDAAPMSPPWRDPKHPDFSPLVTDASLYKPVELKLPEAAASAGQ